MKYILSYINMPNDVTHNFDREFTSFVGMMRFVEQEYREYTSYQIIVVRTNK